MQERVHELEQGHEYYVVVWYYKDIFLPGHAMETLSIYRDCQFDNQTNSGKLI